MEQLQQEQLQQEQLQHVTEPSSSAVGVGNQYHGAGMDVQVLHSSVTTPQAPTLEQLATESAAMARATSSSTVSLESLGANSSNSIVSVSGENSVYRGQQQAFTHIESSNLHHHLHNTTSSLSQQQPSASSLFTSTQEPHITTVVIPPPLDTAMQPHSPVTLSDSILDTLQTENSQEQNLRRELESLATEQFISHQLPVPVELSSTISSGNGGGNNGMSVTTVRPELDVESVPVVSSCEGESVSSPIPDIDVTSSTDMVFSSKNF